MDTSTQVSQCGLCKVDLKGRFVFVDEEIVKLFGASPEELFGRPLIEFLHGDSKELFEHFLYKRNNYESVYETTVLHLQTKGGEIQTRTAIISLNFVGGNPVNIQIIFIPGAPTSSIEGVVLDATEQEEFANNLFSLSSQSDFKSATDFIRSFTKSQITILYLCKNSQLEPRSISADEQNEERVHRVATELEDIHFEIALNPGEQHFSRNDKQCEYICSIAMTSKSRWLLRLIADDECLLTPELFLARAKIAGRLLSNWLSIPDQESSQGETGEQDGSLDIRFAVGLLDVLKIGAIITDCDGQVIGFNPALSGMLQVDGEGLNLNQLAEILAGDDNPVLLKKLSDALTLVEGSQLEDVDLMLPSGGIGRLRIVRLGDTPSDLQACIVIVPSFVSVRDFTAQMNSIEDDEILNNILSKFPAS